MSTFHSEKGAEKKVAQRQKTPFFTKKRIFWTVIIILICVLSPFAYIYLPQKP
jgi:hypothetical protein